MAADTPQPPPPPIDAAFAERVSIDVPDSPHVASFRALLLPGHETFAAPSNQALLLAAQHAGITLVSSCRNGTCRACLCRLQSGTVTYSIAWPGVSLDEKRGGLILPCVACAASDVVLAPLGDA